MKHYSLYLIFVVLFGLLFLGCGSDDGPTGPNNGGTFTVSITGAVTKTFNGIAWFWGGTVEGQSGFALWMTGGDDDEYSGEGMWLVREGAARPGTGSYVVGDYYDSDDEDWNVEHFFAWYSDEGNHFRSVSGTINVSASSNNRFAGSFQLSASGYSNENWEEEIEVTISGEFDAVGGQFGFFPKPFHKE